MEDAWSWVVSIMLLLPQIFVVLVLQVTGSVLLNCSTSRLIFISSFIAPLWAQTVPFVKTSVVLYGPCFLFYNLFLIPVFSR